MSVAYRSRRLRDSMKDAVKWTLGVYSFKDNDRFAELNNVLSNLRPSRVFVPELAGDAANLARNKKFRSALVVLGDADAESDCKIVSVASKYFRSDPDTVKSDLKIFLGTDTMMHHHTVLDLPLAISSVGCLLQQMRMRTGLREADHGAYELKRCDLTAYMRLDRSAVQALNLFPTAQDRGVKFTNVLDVLDHTVTSGMGTRLMRRWLRQPLMSRNQIRARQSMVDLFVRDDILRQTLREGPLKGVLDIPKAMRQLESKNAKKSGSNALSSAKLKSMYLLYRMAFEFPDAVSALEAYEGKYKDILSTTLLDAMRKIAGDMGGYIKLCEHVIDMKKAETLPPEYLVDPYNCSAVLEDDDGKLADISESMEETRSKIFKLYDDVEAGWGRSHGIKLENDATSGYCMRYSKTKQKAVQTSAKRAGVLLTVVKIVNKGVYVRTDTMTRLARKLKDLTSEYRVAQRRVVDEAVNVALTYAPVFEAATKLLSELDVYLSLAHTAAHAPCGGYCMPEIGEPGEDLIVEAARHPCVELQDLASGGDFIANNYTLTHRSADESKQNAKRSDDDNGHFVVMTGPNMGGKSTYIRQLGTIVVMAQMGSFVPCASARIPIFDSVMARVGAGDHQLRGVSTFMAEMLEAAAIMQSATKNSLVIIDELGRGTSTYDGFGLAWAIAEHLATKTRCFSLFATHFHEMTTMAEKIPGVVNRHVSAHTTNDSITMLYQVESGPCDRSFGVHVAELANFPPRVIRDAKRRVQELEGDEDDETVSPLAPSAKKRKLSSTNAGVLDDITSCRNFVKAFADLPFDKMDPKERSRRLRELIQGTPVRA